jgi:hypothetical protein
VAVVAPARDCVACLLAGTELGHRAQVLEFELGGAFGADSEEGFVELSLDSVLCFFGDALSPTPPPNSKWNSRVSRSARTWASWSTEH